MTINNNYLFSDPRINQRIRLLENDIRVMKSSGAQGFRRPPKNVVVPWCRPLFLPRFATGETWGAGENPMGQMGELWEITGTSANLR